MHKLLIINTINLILKKNTYFLQTQDAHSSVGACVRVILRVRVRVSVCVCVRARVCACAGERARVRVSVCSCVRAFVLARLCVSAFACDVVNEFTCDLA